MLLLFMFKIKGVTTASTGEARAEADGQATSGSHGEQGRGQEGGGDADPLALASGERTPVGSEARGPRVRRLDSRDAVEGIVTTGEDLGGASGSGSGGGDNDVQTESPSRDSAKGKGPAVAEETFGEVPMEPVEFIPVAGSSGYRPITRGNFAKFVDEGMLECLLQENPAVAAAVLAAR